MSRYRARAEQVAEPADRRFARARKHDAAKLHEKHGEELIYLQIYKGALNLRRFSRSAPVGMIKCSIGTKFTRLKPFLKLVL